MTGKAALIPFGLGWTGSLVLFMPDSPTLDDFLDLDASAAVHIPWSVTLRLVDRILSRLPGTADFARELLRLARAGEPADVWRYLVGRCCLRGGDPTSTRLTWPSGFVPPEWQSGVGGCLGMTQAAAEDAGWLGRARYVKVS